MLRRLTLGLFTLASVAAVAACSSGNTTVPSTGGVPGNGPNFPTNTIYVSNTTQNDIELYPPSPGPSATPQFLLTSSLSSPTLSGPAYLAFDSSKRLYATSYAPANSSGSLMVLAEFATGNVIPLSGVSFGKGVQPHGIGILPKNAGSAVAFTFPGGFFPNFVNLYAPVNGPTLNVTNTIAGGNTQLNNPMGVAVDPSSNIYVANSGSGTVTIYPLPTSSPTPSGSPSPTPTPTATPSATPTGSASPSPTPTPSSLNIAPRTTITCTCLHQPTGIGLDSNGNVYVTDPGSSPPAIYEFSASGLVPGTVALTPLRVLTSSTLVNPTDVKIDSAGNVYVVDAGSGPSTSTLLIFKSGASSPSTTIALPAGSATGLALSP
jgi:hypothetical protein